MNRADMLYDLSAVWAITKDVFPYFYRIDFDFDELYLQYIDKILSVDSEKEFHCIMKKFVSSLNDGHTRYYAPEQYEEKQPFVKPDAPSYTYLNEILTIKINDFFNDYSGLVKEAITKYPESKIIRLDIRSNIGGNTYYAVKIAELLIPGEFSGCRKWTQTHKGNNLASASQIASMSRQTIDKYVSDGLMKEEDVNDALKTMNRTKYEEYTDTYGKDDHRVLYDGPIEILIAKGTMSAAEDFTAFFKSSKRAKLIGEATYGSTGTPFVMNLRCGGRVQIVSVGYKLLDGTEFIGKGIQPDEYN